MILLRIEPGHFYQVPIVPLGERVRQPITLVEYSGMDADYLF